MRMITQEEMRTITQEEMRGITQEEIDEKLEAHKLWLDTNGEQGGQAIFKDVLITNKDFFRQNLSEVIFENVACTCMNFTRANLSFSLFKNVYFRHVNFSQAILIDIRFWYCNIADTTYHRANLKDAKFIDTTLSNVDFRNSNLHYTNFSTAKFKNIFVSNATPMNIIGQKVICTQVNTSRRNNLISYWADLGIWTTGCFQGTLEELREAVAKTHKDNPFLRDRYERAINYILEEDRADKEKELRHDR